MGYMDGVSFQVGGRDPRGAADAAAEDEIAQVFVAEFVDCFKEAGHDGCVSTAWTEGKSQVS